MVQGDGMRGCKHEMSTGVALGVGVSPRPPAQCVEAHSMPHA